MAQAAPTVDERGPAAGVTWNLGDLYAGPDDPGLASDLARSRGAATSSG
jgi:hypothetical protein